MYAGYKLAKVVCVLAGRFAVMSGVESGEGGHRGSPTVPRSSRPSRRGSAGENDYDVSRRSSSSSPVPSRPEVNRPQRRAAGGRSQARQVSAAGEGPWNAVIEALAEMRQDITKLKAERSVPSTAPTAVNEGAGTSTGEQRQHSPAYFSGFNDSASEEEQVRQELGGSSMLQAAKTFGPADVVSADIDPKIADMVNFVFNCGLREEDYRDICEDDVVKRPGNCPALAPVDCNPQVLEALRTDAKKADFRLKDVNKDIQRSATIILKSLLRLDKMAQDEGNAAIAQEVSLLNGALALLGNANHKNNIARRFVMKRELNQKYAHLCSDKVPMSRLLFGDDVSLSAKQIEDSEKLKNKISVKKPASTWKFAGGRSRGFWGRPAHRGWSSRVQPYVTSRPAYRSGPKTGSSRLGMDSKNGRGRHQYKPRQ